MPAPVLATTKLDNDSSRRSIVLVRIVRYPRSYCLVCSSCFTALLEGSGGWNHGVSGVFVLSALQRVRSSGSVVGSESILTGEDRHASGGAREDGF